MSPILLIENLKLRVVPLRSYRKVIEVRLKKRAIRTPGEEETTFGTFFKIFKIDIPSLFGPYIFLQDEFGDEVCSIGK